MRNLPNIVLIVVDTLRADALSLYGGSGHQPNFEAVARDGVVLKQCKSVASWTIPSHASIFTGMYPSEHGVHESSKVKISDPSSIKLLLESNANHSIIRRLDALGYNTFGISCNDLVSSLYGFDSFFKYFEFSGLYNYTVEQRDLLQRINSEISSLDGEKKLYKPDIFNLIFGLRFKELLLLKQKLNVLRNSSNGFIREGFPKMKGGNKIVNRLFDSSIETPFLLFINFMEMHEPYLLKKTKFGLLEANDDYFMDNFKFKPHRNSEVQKMKNIYYKNINEVDKYLGLIVRYLRDSNIYDNTLIIITSDHGQSFKEHGYYGHGIFLYDELVDIPTILKPPKNFKFIIDNDKHPYFSHLDIYQSILECSELDTNIELGNNYAISQSFGVQNDYSNNPNLNIAYFNSVKKNIDCKRQAFFKNGYKLTLNGTLGTVESFEYRGKEVDQIDNKIMKEMVEEFAVINTEKNFIIPEV